MEKQDNSSPNPNNYITNINNFVIANGNHNLNPMYSQHTSTNPSPTTPAPQITMMFGNSDDSTAEAASPSVFNEIYHGRTYSDGNYQITAADDNRVLSGDSSNSVYTPSFEEIGYEEDELVATFLNEDNIGYGQMMDHNDDGGGDGKPKKSTTRASRRIKMPEELAQIWADDPKRVKRILANRQSAARSKERKIRYTLELERRIQSLQSESTNLHAQVTIYERETKGLSTENIELKLRLRVLEEQADFRDAINEALRHEIETLKIVNAELKTPSEQSTSQGRSFTYSPSASPTTLTLKPLAHFSPLTSPLALQPPSHRIPLSSSSNLQPPARFSLLSSPLTLQTPAQHYTSLASSSPVQTPVHYSPLASPSTVQTTHLNPLTSSSTVQNVPFNKATYPSTPQVSSPRPSVYTLAPLPPLHRSQSSIISRRLRQENVLSTTTTEQNDSSGGSNRGLNLVNAEGALVCGSGSVDP